MGFSLAGLKTELGRQKIKQRLLREFFYNRGFKAQGKRLLFIYEDNSIAISQAYPFLYYQKEIAQRYDYQVRAISAKSFFSGKYQQFRDIDVVCFQTWFDVDKATLASHVDKIKQGSPNATLIYYDWFAPLDLRLASTVNEFIDFYVKKQFYRTLDDYKKPTMGDTSLEEFYGHNGPDDSVSYKETLFEVPEDFYPKIVVGPGFFTADFMLSEFEKPFSSVNTHRDIDIHARMGSKGTPWYQSMRSRALESICAIKDVSILSEMGVPHHVHMNELAHSKICFSPFGYGEVCWRDYESALSGSLILKPNMSHLQTDPDIFVPNETYVATQWDFSDLEEKVQFYLENDEERTRITKNAYNVLHDYVKNKTFVDEIKVFLERDHLKKEQ